MDTVIEERHGTPPVQVRMTSSVFEQIRDTIGARSAETGGILGGNRQTGEITHFCFDEAPRAQNGVAYTPNTAFLSSVIKTEWKPQGIEFLGSIHSHPPFYQHPSPGDEVYARRILEAMELPYLLVHIVMTAVDTGAFSLRPFAAVLGDNKVRIVEQELLIEDKTIQSENLFPPNLTEETLRVLCLLTLGGVGLFAFGVATTHVARCYKRGQNNSAEKGVK